MSKFKVGDKVKAVNQTYGWGAVKKGDIGVVVGDLYVNFPAQQGWSCRESDLELVDEVIVKTTLMKTVSTMMKRLLDADTQKLIKAGYINGDLELTDEGRKELFSIIFVQNKEELVKFAEEKIAEAEESKS